MNNHINKISKDLKIKRPKVSHDTSVFTSPTMMAMVSPDGKTIHIKNEKPNPDLFFAISHELRHIWQMNNAPHMFDSYLPREQCMTTTQYNLQEAELDANAYAGHTMIILYGLHPRFDGMADIVKEEIFKRMEKLK